MIRPRWKKVLADLWSHKTRSLLVVASITVGLFAVGMISTVHGVLAAGMRTSYAKVNPANIQVRAQSFDRDFVDRVRHLPGVKDAVGAAVLDLRIKIGPDQWKAISIKALPDLNHSAEERGDINRMDLLEGAWPPEDKQIVVDTNKLADLNARLGDEVEIKLPSGDVRKMKLVGVVHDQTIGSGSGAGGFFIAPAQGYVTYDTLSWLEYPSTLNALYVTVSDQPNNVAHLHEVANRVLNEFDQNGYITLNSVVRRTIDHPNVVYVDAIGAVLFVMGFLVVFLSGFLITNTLSALLNQQIQQVGIMKTIGASRTQIIGIYVAQILVFSLVALAISLPLANQAAYWIMVYLSHRINFNLQGFQTVPQAIILQVVIALVVPQLAGAIPILQGTRITIQQAISGVGRHTDEGEAFIHQLLSRIKGLSRPLLISLRNTFRRRVRLALTLITLILAGAIFIATFNVRAYLDNYIARLGKYFVADVSVTLDRPYPIEQITEELNAVPGVTYVEAWTSGRVETLLEDGTSGETVQLLAPPVGSKLIEPIILEGRWIQPGDENAIVLSELFYERYPHLKVGDPIRLQVNGDKTDWVVVGFFQFAGKSGGLFAYTDFDTMARLTHTPGKSFIYRVVGANGTGANSLPLNEQEALGRRIESHLADLGYHVSDIRAGHSLQKMTTDGLNTLTTFLLIMAILMAVVGSIGLMGTMSLNVMERTREIGILRAIGASDKAIMNMVIVEGMIIGLVSWLLGCLIAIPITQLMSDQISMAIFSTSATFTFTLSGILIWLLAVIVLSILASVIPARSAARLTIREVLAYE